MGGRPYRGDGLTDNDIVYCEDVQGHAINEDDVAFGITEIVDDQTNSVVAAMGSATRGEVYEFISGT